MSDEGAGATINKVHSSYGEQMKSLARDLRERLNYKDTDPEAQRIKIIARLLFAQARTKQKTKLAQLILKLYVS